MNVLLGPCPCIDCRRHVFLARSENGKGPMKWREKDGRPHACPMPVKVAA